MLLRGTSSLLGAQAELGTYPKDVLVIRSTIHIRLTSSVTSNCKRVGWLRLMVVKEWTCFATAMCINRIQSSTLNKLRRNVLASTE